MSQRPTTPIHTCWALAVALIPACVSLVPPTNRDGLGAPLPVDASPRGQAAAGQQPTFSCFICYESVPLSERYVASESASAATCPHLFCRACVRAYLTCRTEEGFIVNNCPMIGAEGCELVYGSVAGTLSCRRGGSGADEGWCVSLLAVQGGRYARPGERGRAAQVREVQGHEEQRQLQVGGGGAIANPGGKDGA